MSGSKTLLTRAECTALKGIAIIGIILHNFFHVMPGYARENEYRFLISNVEKFAGILERHSLHLPLQIISYGGFMTLGIFLMLTGYGLVVKYENRPEPLRRARFVWEHYVKLLRLMFVPLVMITFVAYFHPMRPLGPLTGTLELLMLSNVLNTDYFPGPFWYFSMIFQAYVLYALVIYRKTERGRTWSSVLLVVMTLVFTLLQWLFEPESPNLEWYRLNVVAYLPAFTLGVLLGRYANRPWLGRTGGAVMAVVCTLALWPMSRSYGWWMWIYVPAALAGIGWIKALPWLGARPMQWIGRLSSYLFANHATSRQLFWDLAIKHPVTWLIPYLVVAVLLSMAHRWADQRNWFITSAFTRK